MTVEQLIEQEANEQIIDIKKVFPNIGKEELKYIFICLKKCYAKGAITALSLASENQIK